MPSYAHFFIIFLYYTYDLYFILPCPSEAYKAKPRLARRRRTKKSPSRRIKKCATYSAALHSKLLIRSKLLKIHSKFPGPPYTMLSFGACLVPNPQVLVLERRGLCPSSLPSPRLRRGSVVGYFLYFFLYSKIVFFV